MKYVGSKSRVAKDISSIINNIIQEQQISTYIEPFVGGGNLIQHIVCDNKFGYDNNEYLIEFWKQIQNGWNPLNDIVMTKDFYTDVRNNPNLYPKHIVALCGFCATYQGKWFGGYANISYTKTGKVRNYYNEAVRNVLKQKDYIKDVIFDCKSYEQIQTSNSLIYCDPPYANTTKYKDNFDNEKYWDWVRNMSKTNIVLCSEYSAPDDFECIWSKSKIVSLNKDIHTEVTEKLFKFKL